MSALRAAPTPRVHGPSLAVFWARSTVPDWMPKQAHMADLQAAAVATNLLGDLQGRPSSVTFKVELICIVDALDQGTLIWRTAKRNWLLPPTRLLHWVKRGFEWLYLRQYR